MDIRLVSSLLLEATAAAHLVALLTTAVLAAHTTSHNVVEHSLRLALIKIVVNLN